MPTLMPPQELYSLLVWFAPCFTVPSFAYFVSFIVCFAAGLGRMTATTVYRTSPRASHWTNYSRFLSRYRWSVSALSARLLELLIDRCGLWLDDQGRRRLCLVIDETIVEKSSKHRFGVGWQRNTHGGWCRGTHILGHYWLMVGLLVRVAGRTMCLPVAFGMYRQKKRCPADEYRTPCQVARGHGAVADRVRRGREPFHADDCLVPQPHAGADRLAGGSSPTVGLAHALGHDAHRWPA